MIQFERVIFIVALASGLSVFLPSLAIAQEENEVTAETIVNITTLSCRDLLLADNDDEESIVIFIQGYISGKSNQAEIDTDALRVASDRSYEDCIDNPDASVLNIFEQNR